MMTSSLMQKDVMIRLVVSFLHVYNKQNKREPFSVWSHEEKLGKVFLAVRTEKNMSHLDKKAVQFSPLKGF